MPVGFYVTLKRGRRTAWLLGPFDTREAAAAKIPDARRAVEEIDPFCHFDAIGTARVEQTVFFTGRLNDRIPL